MFAGSAAARDCGGELSAAVELRRLVPGITDTAQAAGPRQPRFSRPSRLIPLEHGLGDPDD